MSRGMYVKCNIKGDDGFKMHAIYFDMVQGSNSYGSYELENIKIRKLLMKTFKSSTWCLSHQVAYGFTDHENKKYAFLVGVRDEEDLIFLKLKFPNCIRITSWDSNMPFFMVENKP